MDATEGHLPSLHLDNSGGYDVGILNHRAARVSSPLTQTNAPSPTLADFPSFGTATVGYHCLSSSGNEAPQSDHDGYSGGSAFPSGCEVGSVAGVSRVPFDCPTPATSTSPVASCAVGSRAASVGADLPINDAILRHQCEPTAVTVEDASLHKPERQAGIERREDVKDGSISSASCVQLKLEKEDAIPFGAHLPKRGEIGTAAQAEHKTPAAEVEDWNRRFEIVSPSQGREKVETGEFHEFAEVLEREGTLSSVDTGRNDRSPSQAANRHIEPLRELHFHLGSQASETVCFDPVVVQHAAGTCLIGTHDDTAEGAHLPMGTQFGCEDEVEARDSSHQCSSQQSNEWSVSGSLLQGIPSPVSDQHTQVVEVSLGGVPTPVENVSKSSTTLPLIQELKEGTVSDTLCTAPETQVVEIPLVSRRESNLIALNSLWHPSSSGPAEKGDSPDQGKMTNCHVIKYSQGEQRQVVCSGLLSLSGTESRLASIDPVDPRRGEIESEATPESCRGIECAPPRYSSGDLSSAFSPPRGTLDVISRCDSADMTEVSSAPDGETSSRKCTEDGCMQQIQKGGQEPSVELINVQKQEETMPPAQNAAELHEGTANESPSEHLQHVETSVSPPGGTASRLLRAFTPFAFGSFKGGNKGQTSTAPMQHQQSPSSVSQKAEYEKPVCGGEGTLVKQAGEGVSSEGASGVLKGRQFQGAQDISDENQQHECQEPSPISASSEEKNVPQVTPGHAAAVNETFPGIMPVRPRTPYNQFLSRLKHPSCGESVQLMRRFVEGFPGSLERQEAARLIHSFLVKTRERLLHADAFAAAAHDPSDYIELTEGLERFLIQKLYPVLPLSTPEDEADDAFFERRIKCLQWVRLQHLDVSEPPNMAALELGCNELSRMDRMRCPREKLGVVFNACKVIVAVIEESRKATGDSTPPSADDLLPLLIYMLIKANPPNLQSNIQFIASYRHPSRLVGEEAYFFTHLCSAAAFIKNVGKSGTQLNMDPQEFQEKLRLAEAALDAKAAREAEERAALEQRASAKEGAFTSAAEDLNREPVTGAALAAAASALSRLEQLSGVGDSASRVGSTRTTADCTPGLLQRTGVSGLQRKRQAQEQQLQVVYSDVLRAPRTFCNVRSVSDLRLGEIPSLLAEYRELVSVLNRAAAVLQQQIKLDRNYDASQSVDGEGPRR